MDAVFALLAGFGKSGGTDVGASIPPDHKTTCARGSFMAIANSTGQTRPHLQIIRDTLCDADRIAQAAGTEFVALYDGLVDLASRLTSAIEAGPTDATLVAAERLAWGLVAKADDASMRFAPAESVAEKRRAVGAVGHA
ncbi:hypothetical protein WK26_25640 [Burkholderia vietnamiensis]|nr:hypothetical protein WK26_25640 [Burkholderia vietnamiensis]KVS39011.1 hypothetical protein WK35_29030 [Burkholderia vietnamiensis]